MNHENNDTFPSLVGRAGVGFYILAKPIGDACNLGCRYCYYAGTGHELYPGTPQRRMSRAVLEEYVRQYIEATPPGGDVLFTWHGGEPTLLPLDFYREAVALQRQYADGRHIDNALQTNGTLITKEWADFLAREHWLTGVSIDGPEWMHDHYRGEGTHARVLQGIELLRQAGAEWNVMAVVSDITAEHPLDFYRYFRDELRQPYVQFTPETETPCRIGAEAWGRFLCAVYDEWVRHDVGQMFVQLFDSTLAGWVGAAPGVCSMGTNCGHAAALEWNGDVYSCDHFVSRPHLLGNIMQTPLYELMCSPAQRAFGLQKSQSLGADCRRCPYLHLCHGECPKNRDEQGHNRLCEGYRRFFNFSQPTMIQMARLLSQGRDADEVMTLFNT